jgi:hypothetical protein
MKSSDAYSEKREGGDSRKKDGERGRFYTYAPGGRTVSHALIAQLVPMKSKTFYKRFGFGDGILEGNPVLPKRKRSGHHERHSNFV